jgi:hypothetical protein
MRNQQVIPFILSHRFEYTSPGLPLFLPQAASSQDGSKIRVLPITDILTLDESLLPESIYISRGFVPGSRRVAPQSGCSAICDIIPTLTKTISQAISNQTCPVPAIQVTHLRRVSTPRTSPGAFSRPPASCTTTGHPRTCPGPSAWRRASGKVTSSARSTTR